MLLGSDDPPTVHQQCPNKHLKCKLTKVGCVGSLQGGARRLVARLRHAAADAPLNPLQQLLAGVDACAGAWCELLTRTQAGSSKWQHRTAQPPSC